MYKSQKTSQTPSEWSWACHVGCADYTHWTIVEEDIAKIPKGGIPESWSEASSSALKEAQEIVKKATQQQDSSSAIKEN